jgi:hypothetical protein
MSDDPNFKIGGEPWSLVTAMGEAMIEHLNKIKGDKQLRCVIILDDEDSDDVAMAMLRIEGPEMLLEYLFGSAEAVLGSIGMNMKLVDGDTLRGMIAQATGRDNRSN